MSLTPQIIAAGDWFLLVYLAIFFGWVVLKKIHKMGQRDGSQEESPPDSTAKPKRPQLDPTLQEFLETLTGQKLDEESPPAPPVAPPAVPPPVTRVPTPTVTPARAMPLQSPEMDRPGVLDPISYERPELHGDDMLPPAETIVAPHVESTVLGAASSLAGIQTPRISMPSLKLPSQRLDTDHRLTVSIGTKEGLRRAVIERIVLGKPLAMGTEHDELQTGW